MVRRASTIGANRKHYSCGRQTPTQTAIKLTPITSANISILVRIMKSKHKFFKETEGEVIIFLLIFATSILTEMIETFNTGETQESLRQEYNPDGSVLRKAQLRLLDMAIYLQETAKKIGVLADLMAECVRGNAPWGIYSLG